MIEDCGISYEKLADEFGPEVAEGVLALSKNNIIKSKPEKMKDSLARIKQQPREIWMVKLADRITNLQPPPGNWDVEKIDRYREEGRVILRELGKRKRDHSCIGCNPSLTQVGLEFINKHMLKKRLGAGHCRLLWCRSGHGLKQDIIRRGIAK